MVDINIESTTTSGLNFYYLPYLNLTFEEPFVVFDTSYDFNFNFSSDELYILRSSSNVFNSIWCEPNASLYKGRFYLTHAEDFTIVSHSEGRAYMEDYYSTTISGRSEQTLKSNDITDLNLILT